MVNIEANAMGTPVVAYNSPGLVDSVSQGKNGVICKVNSPSEMVDEIVSLLDDPKRYRQLEAGAVLWSRKFTWKKSRKMSLTLIEQLVN